MTHSEPNLIFAQNLRRLMVERHVGLGTLARAVGMPKSTLHNWMFGGKPGDFIALKKIADYFGVSIDEICFGKRPTESANFFNNNLDLQNPGINIGSYEIILLRRKNSTSD